MGDGWKHSVVLEATLPAEAGKTCPLCLAGSRSCPPEDCGGPYGYEDFLKAIGDKKHPQHKEMLEWIGGDFDPELFDQEETNAVLAEIDYDLASEDLL
ncbi:MAG: plasmid pRiA4b ORF-3 family protein [Elusimicrobiota bacterium]|nr:plasmid pRiA4b ORF-3 family protein [Elusimicrobiota bacterium]